MRLIPIDNFFSANQWIASYFILPSTAPSLEFTHSHCVMSEVLLVYSLVLIF